MLKFSGFWGLMLIKIMLIKKTLVYCFLCSNALHCLSLVWETIFLKERRSSLCCMYKKNKRLTARHLSQSFQATIFNAFLLEGPFIKIIFVIAFWDAFLCVPLAIQYGMNLKGKYVGWYYKTLFVQLSFWLQFFFLRENYGPK